MNEVTQKNCPMKGSAEKKCGTQELSEQSFQCNNHVDRTKTNLNGLINGITGEKPTIKKTNSKKEKKSVQHSSSNSSVKSEVTIEKLLTEETRTDKQIIDSALNVKNNRKNKKSTKSNKLNSLEMCTDTATKKNNLIESNSSNENDERKEYAISYKDSIPNDVETIPKNVNQNSKKNKNGQKTTLNKSNVDFNLEIDDFDITSYIVNKISTDQATSDVKPSCSKSEETIDTPKQLVVMEKQDLSQEFIDTPLNEVTKSSENKQDLPSILYEQYESELQMPMIMKIIQKDLSEPYSIYTYRYFIHNWPNLCFLAMCEEVCVGAIVCKLDIHRKETKRGYIAMLAVDKNYRNRGIGSTLVRRAIQEMIAGEADEVVLETEITNKPALRLYEALGFVRDKRLFRYYLNGVDALRLKLWLR